MPCYKGISVSIHAEGSPLPEYGTNKQSKYSRVNSYIAVPKQRLGIDGSPTEPAKFAISITLLTPGLPVPYSNGQAIVSGLPGAPPGPPHLKSISPYTPITSSVNETVASYIYFDGRGKEEVATLLRPGEFISSFSNFFTFHA